MNDKKVVVILKIEIDGDNFLSTNFDDACTGLQEIGIVTLESVKDKE